MSDIPCHCPGVLGDSSLSVLPTNFQSRLPQIANRIVPNPRIGGHKCHPKHMPSRIWSSSPASSSPMSIQTLPSCACPTHIQCGESSAPENNLSYAVDSCYHVPPILSCQRGNTGGYIHPCWSYVKTSALSGRLLHNSTTTMALWRYPVSLQRYSAPRSECPAIRLAKSS